MMGENEVTRTAQNAATRAALLREVLDLAPRTNEEDPIAPALAALCARIREHLRQTNATA